MNGLLKQAELIADQEFDGEISLLKLKTGWKVGFGDFTKESQINQVPTFNSFYSGLQWLVDEKFRLKPFKQRSEDPPPTPNSYKQDDP